MTAQTITLRPETGDMLDAKLGEPVAFYVVKPIHRHRFDGPTPQRFTDHDAAMLHAHEMWGLPGNPFGQVTVEANGDHVRTWAIRHLSDSQGAPGDSGWRCWVESEFVGGLS